MTTPTRLAGYCRCSTSEQAVSGLGIAAQRAAITAAAEQRGMQLVDIYEDAGASGKTMANRPGLDAALAAIRAGEANGLIASKVDRVSRSVLDFVTLMECSRREGWALVVLDANIDTTTASGELMAVIVSAFAQHERRLIGQRTKEALAELKEQGVRLGRPPSIPDATIDRIAELRESGLTYRGIVAALNEAGVPTSRGGQWRPATVMAALKSRSRA